jgi:pimeloyl-ACP methyl ester carboxylesterase
MSYRIGPGTLSAVLGSLLFIAVAMAGGQPAPRASRSLEFGSIRVATGPRLQYAAQGPADGPVVILLHGYSDSWYSFSPLLPELPASWRVYALTQRGHGDSEKPVGDYSPPTLARDVVAFMDALDIERATIVGHSLGGIIAQHVASVAPARVERLAVLASVATAQTMPGIAEFRDAIHALGDSVPVEFAREFQESTLFLRPREAFVDSVVAESAKLPAHVWRGIIDGLLATGPAPGLDSLDVPVLVLWGDRDGYMPFAEQIALVDRLRARLIVYPRIGHGLHWEDPGTVAADLFAFIEAGAR